MEAEQLFEVIALSFPADKIPQVVSLLRNRYKAPDKALPELIVLAVNEVVRREVDREWLDTQAEELLK
jgi:hypothetical protein